MKISIPKGTKDILPEDIGKYKFVQTEFANMMENYGYDQIRFPVFEYTELFQRGSQTQVFAFIFNICFGKRG